MSAFCNGFQSCNAELPQINSGNLFFKLHWYQSLTNGASTLTRFPLFKFVPMTECVALGKIYSVFVKKWMRKHLFCAVSKASRLDILDQRFLNIYMSRTQYILTKVTEPLRRNVTVNI